MNLPEIFTDRMNAFFAASGIPSEGFFESFDKDPLKGVRLNRVKTEPEGYTSVLEAMGEKPDPVSWCASGFYTCGEAAGNDPYYHAGVYYPQEPSAMLPAEVMGAVPGDKVLDMCAAPGGKACRLGEDLKGEGLLIANEINETRAKALLRNIERTGIRNAVILNETPEKLAPKFKGFFDKILLDVPCSGEGMFRRDPNAVKSWERFGPDTCMPIQKMILDCADIMLKAGGEIVYSTCTFYEGEDEDMILSFLESHKEYKVIPHPEIMGVTHAGEGTKLPGSMRIFPHLSRGDGHFCVHLKKSEEIEVNEVSLEKLPSYRNKRNDNYSFGKSKEAVASFLKDILKDVPSFGEGFRCDGERVHIMPVNMRYLDRLKVVKFGEYLGDIKTTSAKRIFVPSNSLALTLDRHNIKTDSLLSFGRDDQRLTRYLKGETISVSPDEKCILKNNGYIVIAVDGYPLGFGKISSDGSVKNLYPKAWRLI